MRALRIALFVALVCSQQAVANTPRLLNFQGKLTDSTGAPAPNGSYSVTIRIYTVPSGGTALWTEAQTVTTSNGLFTAVLGQVVPMPTSLFEDSVTYIGVTQGVDPEMTPRKRLTSVPYALHANDGWFDNDTVVHLNNPSDRVGIGISIPIRPLHVSEPSGGLFVSRMESSNTGATVTEISNTSSNSVWETSVAGSAGIPFWGIQPGDMYVYKQGTPWPNAVYTQAGQLGLGTGLPRARLEAVTLDTAAGMFMAAAPTSATHVVHAEYTGVGNYDAVAVYGKSAPADFYGYGGAFEGGFIGAEGRVLQDGSKTYFGLRGQCEGNGTGTKYGVYASASGGGGSKIGVRGIADGGGDTAIGVFGEADPPNTLLSVGVYGKATSGGYGVYGVSDGGVGGLFASKGDFSFALFAAAGPGTDVDAGYFQGDVTVVGTLLKSAGSFRIDHPLDPENKFLQHSFVESPDMMNIYNGNVTTDASGNATVTLPNWFESLNKDFRYQLTVIGQFAQAIVSEKVSNNRFSISTDKPNVEVSWQVTGVRKDPYAELHRIEVEVAKNDHERGKYASPESYGKPRSMGVRYQPALDAIWATPPAIPVKGPTTEKGER